MGGGMAGMSEPKALALRRRAAKLPADVKRAREAIAAARRPEEVRPIETDLEKAENLMRTNLG
jgi:hypothetical protein